MTTSGRVQGISVVVPSYNGSPWIAASLQSVLSQDCDVELQVIVVDDCSSDNTLEVVRQLNDPRIICVSTQRNSGVAAARNLGLSLATQDWIAFNDQDDMWIPGRLSQQLAMLDAYPDMDAIAGSAGRLAADGKTRWIGKFLWWKWSPVHTPQMRNPPYYEPRSEGTVYLQTMIVPAAVARKAGGFNEDLPLSDDLDFLNRVANIARMGCVQEAVFLYRMGSHNQTAPKVAKAKQFLGAQAYYHAALGARNDGIAVPDAADFLANYHPSQQELTQFEFAQQIRAVNTVWVNQGLLSALMVGMCTLCRHPQAFIRHFMSRVRWWRGTSSKQ